MKFLFPTASRQLPYVLVEAKRSAPWSGNWRLDGPLRLNAAARDACDDAIKDARRYLQQSATPVLRNFCRSYLARERCTLHLKVPAKFGQAVPQIEDGSLWGALWLAYVDFYVAKAFEQVGVRADKTIAVTGGIGPRRATSLGAKLNNLRQCESTFFLYNSTDHVCESAYHKSFSSADQLLSFLIERYLAGPGDFDITLPNKPEFQVACVDPPHELLGVLKDTFGSSFREKIANAVMEDIGQQDSYQFDVAWCRLITTRDWKKRDAQTSRYGMRTSSQLGFLVTLAAIAAGGGGAVWSGRFPNASPPAAPSRQLSTPPALRSGAQTARIYTATALSEASSSGQAHASDLAPPAAANSSKASRFPRQGAVRRPTSPGRTGPQISWNTATSASQPPPPDATMPNPLQDHGTNFTMPPSSHLE